MVVSELDWQVDELVTPDVQPLQGGGEVEQEAWQLLQAEVGQVERVQERPELPHRPQRQLRLPPHAERPVADRGIC